MGRPGTERLRRRAEERSALRRVTAAAARDADGAAVLDAVAGELARIAGAAAVVLARVDGPGAPGTVVAAAGRARTVFPPGSRLDVPAGLRTGRPARLDGAEVRTGPFGEPGTVIAAPVTVAGRPWGLAVAASGLTGFPPGAETRLAEFVELVAGTLANAETADRLHRLADTQDALRRLAVLVARGEPPRALYAAVTREVLRHFGTGAARMIRYERDGTATLVADEGTSGPHVRVGDRWDYPESGLTATVRETCGPARVDDYRLVPGAEPYLREGLRSAAGIPILVHGALWGMIAVGSTRGPLPPGTEQRMMEFTDLIATAVANAQSREELMSSRARIVAASDQARRRIERDLHDGAQQHLVALGLRLSAAAAAVPPGCADLRRELDGVAEALAAVHGELREISHGIHPAILSEAGLRPALRSLARRAGLPVDADVRVPGRLPAPIEVTAYYVVSEMLTNAAKHARASSVRVRAEVTGGALRVDVRDDGVGGADPARGSGLAGLKDRVEAVRGEFAVDSPPGRGTAVRCTLPLTEEGFSEGLGDRRGR